MKYDLSKKPTRGAQRTLSAFSDTMFHLVGKTNFDAVSVNEICNVSNFPRATFYNYFDDKYDLLNYCWYLITEDLRMQDQQTIRTSGNLRVYFDRLFELLKANRQLLGDILRHNPLDSTLMNHFNSYLNHTIRTIFYRDLEVYDKRLPISILADHFSNTVMMILVDMFLKEDAITLDQAHEYLAILLSPLIGPHEDA